MWQRMVVLSVACLIAGCAYRPTPPSSEDRVTAERLCKSIPLGVYFEEGVQELRERHGAWLGGGDRTLMFLALRQPRYCACHLTLDESLNIVRSEAQCVP
jgi:hypothetical protein